jgi:hypothetical protein
MRLILLPLLFSLLVGCQSTSIERTKLETARAEEHAEEMKLERMKAEQAASTARMAQMQEWRMGISNVFQARIAVLRDCSKMRKNRPYVDDRKFASAVAGIGTHECPPTFRTSWLAYVQACDAKVRNGGKILFDLGLTFYSAGVGTPKLLADAGKADPTLSTWEAVQRSAMQAGVDCPPDNF